MFNTCKYPCRCRTQDCVSKWEVDRREKKSTRCDSQITEAISSIRGDVDPNTDTHGRHGKDTVALTIDDNRLWIPFEQVGPPLAGVLLTDEHTLGGGDAVAQNACETRRMFQVAIADETWEQSALLINDDIPKVQFTPGGLIQTYAISTVEVITLLPIGIQLPC